MWTSVILVTLITGAARSWVTPVHDLLDLAHFLDIQLEGISSRQELERGYAAFSSLKNGLSSLNGSAVFRQGGTRWQQKSDNLIELFNAQRANIEEVLAALSRAFSLLLARAPLISTNVWPNRASFSCDQSLSINLALYETLARTVELEQSNWLSPRTPMSPEEAWSPQLQSQLESMLTTMTNSGNSVNSTEERINKMNENYRLVMQTVFVQRADTLNLLPALTGYLQDLRKQLENYLLLLGACTGHATSAKSLAFASCPEQLQLSAFENYQVETLTCRATTSQISVSMRVHQQSVLFPQGPFQKMMLASATFSGILSLITYTYLIAKLIQRLRKPRKRQFLRYGKHMDYRRVNKLNSSREYNVAPTRADLIDFQMTNQSAQGQSLPADHSSSAPTQELLASHSSSAPTQVPHQAVFGKRTSKNNTTKN